MKLEQRVPQQLLLRATISSFILLLLVIPCSYGQNDSLVPSSAPIETAAPTAPLPSLSPSYSYFPTVSGPPSGEPSIIPSASPVPTETETPTLPVPSLSPSSSIPPSLTPTTGGPTITASPTGQPTIAPSVSPSRMPSQRPSVSFFPTESFMPSFLPSEPPSLTPTETQGPSPSPSAFPTAPSAFPSESLRPSVSSDPSSIPSSTPSTGAPSGSPSSPRPSSSPSFAPTSKPSGSPSSYPTTFPSSTPTVTMIDVSRLEIKMTMTNFPLLSNLSKIEIWEDQTSRHVERYWNSRPNPAIVVTKVDTFYIRQEKSRRRLNDADVVPESSFTYSQAIRFGFLRDDVGSISGQSDVIFTRPFNRDQQTYIDNLVAALEIPFESEDVGVESIEIVDNSTLPPTAAPSSIPPPSPPVPGASSATVIASSLMAVLILTAVLIAGYVIMSRRKRQNEIDWAAENNHEFMGENSDQDLGEDPVDQPMTSQQLEGEMQAFAVDPNALPYADNEDPNGNDYEYDMPLASPMEPPPSPPANLLGVVDGDSDDDIDHQDPFGQQQALEMSTDPRDLGHSPSFESAGPDELPSLSGFNVTVEDIDDNVSM